MTVAGEQIEHVIEKSHAGIALAGAATVEPYAHVDLCLARGSVDCRGTRHRG
jgi:hypothetical protein